MAPDSVSGCSADGNFAPHTRAFELVAAPLPVALLDKRMWLLDAKVGAIDTGEADVFLVTNESVVPTNL
jgi:hypothetical protein